MKTRRIKDYLVLYLAFFIYSFSSVCAKYAALQTRRTGTLLFMVAEVACLGLYALIYQQALKCFSLVVAMSNKGITVIFGLLWSVLLFGEKVGLLNVIGAALIIVGIGLVSFDD